MPIIVFKDKLNDQKIDIAFNCEYEDGSLVLESSEEHFDCGTYKTKIKEAIDNFSDELFEDYKAHNDDIACLAILDYFTDKIPDIYSIKFIDDEEESVYYTDEL